MDEALGAPNLTTVEGPDRQEVTARFFALRDAHQVAMHRAWLGAIVWEFDNAEISMIAETGLFTVGDVLDLRRLALLLPDEGYDGTRPRISPSRP